MRLLLVSANYRPSVGGIERFTEVLATGLAGRGHEVTVVCCRTGAAPRSERTDGVAIVRVPATNALRSALNVPYPVPSPVSLVRTLSTHVRAADVVHVQDAIYATSVTALALARHRGAPSVVTQHVSFVPQHNAALDAVQRGANATLGRCVRLATSVVTLNPAVASWVAATWGVEASVLPVGSPPISRASDRTAVRARFGLPQDRFLALFVGRDVPKKGLDHVLGASDPAYELVVVTDRPADGDRRATFVPFLPHDSFGELIGAVDAFVLPSVGEGFPIVLQEAFGIGLPVLTTHGPGYGQFLGPEDALFIEPRSEDIRAQLLRLVADPALRLALSERSLAVARRAFGLEPFLQAYERLYEELRGCRRPTEREAAA